MGLMNASTVCLLALNGSERKTRDAIIAHIDAHRPVGETAKAAMKDALAELTKEATRLGYDEEWLSSLGPAYARLACAMIVLEALEEGPTAPVFTLGSHSDS